MPMFSHPRLPKCLQAQRYPTFVKPDMRKTLVSSKYPKILKVLASLGITRPYVVAQIWET